MGCSKYADFSVMFNGCSSLSDITGLEKWDVSSSNSFSSMLSNCLELKDITPLKTWKISKCPDLSNMFNE